ncbi:glucose-1-phosphate adenylyltransferase [Inquilinus sp. CAU 1745]|uniref:glucose-1-phosphate adenylyltransferase n=1 Tax=Inquilinus sp. CAU 1745 TaxID=3140369 RepID=UPI00325B18BB
MREEPVVRQLPRRAIALVLAGGRGSRLHQLTDRRAKPAVHFGGKFRIIDFALSNCINSGFRRIYVLTQYKSHSLLRHLQRGWSHFRAEMNEFVDLLPAQQRIDETMWYRGTADAVRQNVDIFRAEDPDHVIVLAGDHVYKMDYGAMLEDHVTSGAEVTVGCVEVPRMEATGFGVMAMGEARRVTGFLEKPADPPGMPGKPDVALASMGIYIFNAKFLYELLAQDAASGESSHDFGKDIIPYLVANGHKVLAHSLTQSGIVGEGQTEPYWRDAGTIDSYWEANIDLTTVTPALDLYDEMWPVYTYQAQLPPAKFVWDEGDRRGAALDSIVSGGCVVSGGIVSQSLLFSQVRVNSYARLDGAVVLPRSDIGRHARLSRVIVDSGCQIPEGMVVGEDPEEDARRFHRSPDGVVLITRDMLEALD